MKQAIIKALTQNIGLKILAIIFSFFLWLVVVNIDDPTQTRTFTAVVTVTNESALNNSGKLYEIRDNNNTVDFRVTAKRSIIEKLSSSDFNAVADMNYLENDERVPVTITAINYASQVNISSKQNYLYVDIFDQTSNKFVITAESTGEITTGLAVKEVTCSPNVITVSGPEDLVTSIASVKATIDVTDVTADITESVIPVFYDGAGNIIDTSKLQLSASSVDIHVDFESVKSVDIQVKTSGTLADGLSLGSITTDPTSILIKGQPSELNEVTSIVIPESVINLSEITGSMTTTVDITTYLPDGITLDDTASPMVTIFVNMEGEESKTVDVSSKSIRFTNIPDGVTVALNSDSISVSIFGTKSSLSEFSESDLTGYIDCSELTENGEANLILVFDAQENITVQNINVTVTASGFEETSDEENKTDSEDSNKDEETKEKKD